MKIINLFKSVLLTLSFTFFFYFNSLALTLVETPIALDAAWGMTWIDDEQMLITQKSGEIFLVNTLNYSQIKILHDLPFVQYGQGGLLDIHQ
jgi:quinoprotein glucose dehydrogenase